VFDLSGQLIIGRSGLMAAGCSTIDVALRNAGLYFLLVEAAGSRATAKAVVSR
jgi:hypothetical protein